MREPSASEVYVTRKIARLKKEGDFKKAKELEKTQAKNTEAQKNYTGYKPLGKGD